MLTPIRSTSDLTKVASAINSLYHEAPYSTGFALLAGLGRVSHALWMWTHATTNPTTDAKGLRNAQRRLTALCTARATLAEAKAEIERAEKMLACDINDTHTAIGMFERDLAKSGA
ncbi:hypothetical protein [Planktothrix phage Pra-JY27]|nr:tetratricopeptide repeat protein 2 [Planktothrix phage Pag-Yong1]WEV89278.1 hypothetical protein [Synechococcus phage MinM2]